MTEQKGDTKKGTGLKPVPLIEDGDRLQVCPQRSLKDQLTFGSSSPEA